jgi:hypothetical protein
MSSLQEPQHSTLMFARVLGPFLVISCVTAVVRAPQTCEHWLQTSAYRLRRESGMALGNRRFHTGRRPYRRRASPMLEGCHCSYRFCNELASNAARALSAGVPNGLHVDGGLGA